MSYENEETVVRHTGVSRYPGPNKPKSLPRTARDKIGTTRSLDAVPGEGNLHSTRYTSHQIFNIYM